MTESPKRDWATEKAETILMELTGGDPAAGDVSAVADHLRKIAYVNFELGVRFVVESDESYSRTIGLDGVGYRDFQMKMIHVPISSLTAKSAHHRDSRVRAILVAGKDLIGRASKTNRR